MIRELLGSLRRRAASTLARLKQKRTIIVSPITGQAALHDPETDLVKLGDGSFVRLSDLDAEEARDPLTWAEQKEVRLELRRYRTWQALRMKVPKAWEPGE